MKDYETAVFALCQRFIAGEIGVIVAARELRRYWWEFEKQPELFEALKCFVAIDSDTDALPVGSARQYWSREALEREDREIAEAENFHKPDAINHANRIIELLGSTEQPQD